MNKLITYAALIVAFCLSQQAFAIPSFSRQTGIDCQACHSQHMPILNDFGQSFKASGYRTVGKQSTIESENLSIPESLNASMLLRASYQRSNGSADTIPGTSTNGGQWQFPNEFSLFFGGRIASNIGFFFEGNTATDSNFVSAFKLPTAIELRGYNLSVIPFMTSTLGASYGYEQANTGAVRNGTWAEHYKEVSAQQYAGTDGAATGIALVAINDKGYINLSRWAPAGFARSGYAQVLRSTYLRVAATPKIDTQTFGEWALHMGAQVWAGSNFARNTTGSLVAVSTRAIALDIQAFGQLNDQDVSLYATWAKSPAGSATEPNIFNVESNATGELDPTKYRLNDRKALTVGVDYSVIQNTLHVGAAIRSAKNGGQSDLAVAGENASDHAITLTTVYNIAQNIELHVGHSVHFGTLYDIPQSTGNIFTSVLLQAAW
ncbi:MAG: hypothetical protein HOO95_00585 [Gallionella sp.]|nr:hypothetical protein [Gallionella sp.]